MNYMYVDMYVNVYVQLFVLFFEISNFMGLFKPNCSCCLDERNLKFPSTLNPFYTL